ncbi:MAG: tyrosine-type recombinase/integrase, partial [Phycisphaerae bacterium]
MARVYRRTYTKRLADGERVTKPCAKWYIEYVDASGRPRRKAGYTDKRASEAYAAELQRAVDREKAGIIDAESLNLSKQLGASIGTHIEAYRLHLRTAGVSAWHLAETTRRLRTIIEACGFARLGDVKAEPVQRWCALQESEGMSARTRNTYTGSLRAFVRWCVADRRLASDPLVTLGKADETADKRRNRRALSEDELVRLVLTAELRPLAEYGRPTVRKPRCERKKKRDTWSRAALTPDNMAESLNRARESLKENPALVGRLERTGRERALIYRALVLTGLRRGELAALTWGDLSIDTPDAWLTVRAEVAKNRREDAVPIRGDLAADLREWRTECGDPSSTDSVFKVRRDLSRILK